VSATGNLTEYTVNCVTLLLLYVGSPGETKKKLLLRWTEAAMMLDWGSSTLDITTAGIVGISYCFWGFGYCIVLKLAVLTDFWCKLAATYCNNISHGCGMMLQTCPGRSSPCRMPARNTANNKVAVDTNYLHYLTLHWKFLQSVCWKLVSCLAEVCRGIPLHHRFPLCPPAGIWCYPNCTKLSKTDITKSCKIFLTDIIQEYAVWSSSVING